MNTKRERTKAEIEASVLANEARVLARFRGDREFLKEIYSVFLGEIPEKTQMLKQGESACDYSAIEEVAHALRSSSATIGVIACSELASEIENAASVKDVEKLTALTTELFALFDALAPIIEARLKLL